MNPRRHADYLIYNLNNTFPVNPVEIGRKAAFKIDPTGSRVSKAYLLADKINYKWSDSQKDEFVRTLLMPEDFVKIAIDLGKTSAAEIAIDFEVSARMCVNRMVDLGMLPERMRQC